MEFSTTLLLSPKAHSNPNQIKHQHLSDLLRIQSKPDRRLKSHVTPTLSGLWPYNLNTSKTMEFATTFLFTTTIENIIYTTKIIAQSKTANAAQQQWYRKLIGTSEKHNWSSRPPTNMNHNFLKRLGSYLQLSYSHIKMILQLEGSINSIIAPLSKTQIETDMPL